MQYNFFHSQDTIISIHRRLINYTLSVTKYIKIIQQLKKAYDGCGIPCPKFSLLLDQTWYKSYVTDFF